MADLQVRVVLKARLRHDVEWNAVKAKFDQWNYKAEGLTQGAAALIALAVTIATQGAASGLAGSLVAGAGFTTVTATGAVALSATGAALSSALTAGMTTLASRAAVSLINNKGDLSKVFKELGSSAFLKSLATSMITAGLTAGLPTDILPVAPQGGTLSFAQMLQANIVRNAIGATVGTAIQGGDLGDSLSNALIQAAVQSVGAQGAIAIGALAHGGEINKALQLIAHAALGCAIGTATSGTRDGGKGCVGGAVGGVVGELAAEAWLADRLEQGDLESVLARNPGINVAKFMGGLAVLVAGGNVSVGAFAAGNAAEYNGLKGDFIRYVVGKILAKAPDKLVGRYKDKLDKKHLDAARREKNGEVVARKPDGTPYDHVTEVQDAMKGLENHIRDINQKLGSPSSGLSAVEREALKGELSEASKLLDYARGYLK